MIELERGKPTLRGRESINRPGSIGPVRRPHLYVRHRAVEARQGRRDQKAPQDCAIAIAVLVAFGFVIASPDGFGYMIYFGWGVFMLWKYLDSDPPTEFGRAARAAESHLRNLQDAWLREATVNDFNAKLDELRTLSEEYRKLPERRKQKIRELERALYETQLRHYLQKFDIASADIPHAKDGRKAMLSAYGIDDASDVARSALENVPGFGHFLIIQLITWRQSLEAAFKFNPGRGIDPADIQRVDLDVAKRRIEIEALLSKGPSELNGLRRRIIAARGRLQGQLEKALMDVAQAQADERAAA